MNDTFKRNELLREQIAQDREAELDSDAAYAGDRGVAYARNIARKMRMKYPKIFENQKTLDYAIEEINQELDAGVENDLALYDTVLEEIYTENDWPLPGPSEAEIEEQIDLDERRAAIEHMRQQREKIRGNVV